MMNGSSDNTDQAEIAKFDALAHRWWDPEGEFRPLHDINPVRLNYIMQRTDLANGAVLDVGCGGGIIAEAMAATGADVTGIDMAETPLAVARLHAMESGTNVHYRQCTAETLAAERPGHFHTITCLEMLEHVPDFSSTVQACADLAAPGAQLFFSTINRHPKAYALLVLGAEYVLRILPRGTHDYRKFIKPSELSRAVRNAGLTVRDISGYTYNPFSRQATLSADVNANYLIHASKD